MPEGEGGTYFSCTGEYSMMRRCMQETITVERTTSQEPIEDKIVLVQYRRIRSTRSKALERGVTGTMN